jgi:hypothetical protein
MRDPKFKGEELVQIPDGRIGKIIGIRRVEAMGEKEFLYSINTSDGHTVDKIPERLLARVQVAKYFSNRKLFKYSGAIDENIYIKKVIYNDPATIILWSDGTKTSSKCDERDVYNPELGLTIAFLKRLFGSNYTTKLLKDWIPEEPIGKLFPKTISLTDLRRKERHENEK